MGEKHFESGKIPVTAVLRSVLLQAKVDELEKK